MDEDFPSRIEAVFPDRESARAAAMELQRRFTFDKAGISLVPPDQHGSRVHGSRFAFHASGSRLQKRQLTATLIAFVLIGAGLILLQASGLASQWPRLASAIEVVLVLAAVAITAIGLLSWRPARVQTRQRLRPGETGLVVLVHNVSEQHEIRSTLLEMGARVERPVSASVS
jgi:hypothetical protein